MAVKTVPRRLSIAAILLLPCFFSVAPAFNITRILNQHPNYSTFNDLLTRTGLASEINRRSTITVLVVSNDRLGDLSSRPIEAAKSILRTHVILDYFDLMKLNHLEGQTAKLTNMYQETGVATYDQGFLNVTTGNDGILFGSAVKGAPHDARLEGSVLSRPYNISVLSISHPIVSPGLGGSIQSVAAPPPRPPKSVAPAPIPSHKGVAPAPVPSHKQAVAPTPVEADAPSDDIDSSDYSPAGSPPEPADGPEAADGPETAEGPNADADTQDASESSAGKYRVSVGGFFLFLGALVAAL